MIETVTSYIGSQFKVRESFSYNFSKLDMKNFGGSVRCFRYSNLFKYAIIIIIKYWVTLTAKV
eukprot:snap_masked-scaffold_84-processed-gene-0.0-mRNA-1 protein AED:1.00 eAED:1.00 QI:0/0/0/0/1/1/2/0/62